MTAQPLAAQPIEMTQQAQPIQQAQAPQTHTVVTHQQTVYVHRPVLDSMFSGKMVAIISIVGVLLLFLGAIMGIAAKNTEKTDADDAADRSVTAQTNFKIGMILMAVGAMLMLMFMLGAAAMSPDIPANVRVGFLVFSAIVILSFVFLVLGFISPLSETGPTIFD
jgi:uncharacterized Tic20 family protein